MTAEEFKEVLERRLELTRSVLAAKAGDYASAKDRLHNFKFAGSIGCCTPHQSLLGMLLKHWTSVADMVTLAAAGGHIERARVDEKIGDAVNYLILLEALFVEEDHHGE